MQGPQRRITTQVVRAARTPELGAHECP
jgi:hypothetical protein